MVELSLTNEFEKAKVTIVEDISKNPKKYQAMGQWLNTYMDKEKVWHTIEVRCKGILDQSFKRQDYQESPGFIMPESVLKICRVLQAVAVVDLDFLPDISDLKRNYESQACLASCNLKKIDERIATRAKIIKFLGEIYPGYKSQAELLCDYHGLYVACEELIEKHDKIGLLNKSDNLKVCLLTWLIFCNDLGVTESTITEFEKVPWDIKVGTEPIPHRAKVLQILETCELLPKWQKLACKASNDINGTGSQPDHKKKRFVRGVWIIITGIIVVAGGFYTFIQIWESETVQKWISKVQTQKQVDNQAVSSQIPVKNSNDPNQKKP
jgi:hypothetical protein